jgi:hypothetical protein
VWGRQFRDFFRPRLGERVLVDVVSAMIPVLAGGSITATNEPPQNLRTAAHTATTSAPRA